MTYASFELVSSLFALFASLTGVIINMICLVYTRFYLRVSTHIKKILFAMVLHNILAFTSMTLAQVWALVDPKVDRFKCLLQTLPLNLGYPATYIFTAVIAVVRYYMAARTANNRFVNLGFIVSFEEFFILFVFTFDFLQVFLSFGTNVLGDSLNTQSCLGDNPLRPSLSGSSGEILAFVAIVTSLGFDLAMVAFIRKRARVAPIRLVVWTTESAATSSSQDDLKDTIPVNSSILSTLSLVMLASVTGCMAPVMPSNYATMASALVLLTHLPLILILTVKSQEGKASRRPNPPPGLQYHETF